MYGLTLMPLFMNNVRGFCMGAIWLQGVGRGRVKREVCIAHKEMRDAL